jgi:hypothetical protein
MHIGYWWVRQKERDHYEDVGGWIILRWILREIGRGGTTWIDLAQNKD